MCAHTVDAVDAHAGDEVYREWGWNMFRAFERWTRLETGGYATLSNVNSVRGASTPACSKPARPKDI
jgi:hypothetical protein